MIGRSLVDVSSDERLVAELSSHFGPLSVTESEGRRSLWVGRGRVCQGIVERGRVGCGGLPYAALVLTGLALAPRLARVLVVGLGAGVIPRFVHAYFPDTQVDVVEIDPVVVEVAQRWFEVEPDARLHVHVEEGRRFIMSCTRRYDAIVLDGYGLHEVPAQLSTCEFLQGVRARLQPGGVVLGNLWGDARVRHHARMLASYVEVFGRIGLLHDERGDNTIVLAHADGRVPTRDELVTLARDMSRAQGLPVELGATLTAVEAIGRVEAEALRDVSERD